MVKEREIFTIYYDKNKSLTIGAERRQVEGKRGFSKYGFENTRVTIRNGILRIATTDKVARRYIVLTVAKECAFV